MSVPPEIKKLRGAAWFDIGKCENGAVTLPEAETAVSAALARQRDEIVEALLTETAEVERLAFLTDEIDEERPPVPDDQEETT